MKPIRVQRKRTRGFKLPENIVCVTRPGRYDNPFIISGDMIFLNVKFRRPLLYLGRYWQQGTQADCVYLFRKLLNGDFNQSEDTDLQHWVMHFKGIRKDELKGKNLACWCKIGYPCHGDVLLEIVNA